MTVYIEYVLIDNFFIDYLLLRAALKTAGISVNRLRLFFSALIGAGVALVYPLLEIHPAILFAVKMLSGGLIVLTAAKFGRARAYFTSLVFFLLYTFLAGGAITGIYSLMGLNPSSETSVALMLLPVYVIIRVSYGAIRHIYRKRISFSLRYRTDITAGGVTVTVNGFMDTGNGLYAGEAPVIMCSKKAAEHFFEGGALPKMTMIPVTTVNGTKERPVFFADRVEIFAGEKTYRTHNAAVCVIKEGLETGFDAILHPALLAGKECGTSGGICAPEGGNGRGAEEKERAASGGENRDSGKEKGERSA